MRNARRQAAAAASIVFVLLAAGCATPADQKAMTVAAPVAAGKQHPASVAVTTSGGAGTGAMESSNISNADLQAAIESSIQQQKLFREVVKGKSGDYDLSVSVIQLSKPSFGLTFTVDLEAGWTLTRASDRKVMYRQSLTSSGTAGVGEAFAGVVRLRLAVEKAAQANIAQGLKAIAALDL
jgi:hypothetical protein